MSGETFDVPIPLVGGVAWLRIPTPITARNLDLLRRAVGMHLDFYAEILEIRAGDSSVFASPATESETT